MKRLLFLLVLITIVTLNFHFAFAHAGHIDFANLPTLEPTVNADQTKTIIVNQFKFTWKIEGNTNLTCVISTPTKGYLGVGFDPIKPPMKGANIIIGYIDDKGKLSIRDDFGNAKDDHVSDEEKGGKNNIINAAGIQVDGITTIQFTIPLDSGDQYDTVLKPGELHTLIFARGPIASFTKKHKKSEAAAVKVRL